MVNANLLRAEWVKKGLNQKQVADLLGICEKTLGMKLKKGVFLSNEIEALISALDIENPMPIFLQKKYLNKLLKGGLKCKYKSKCLKMLFVLELLQSFLLRKGICMSFAGLSATMSE